MGTDGNEKGVAGLEAEQEGKQETYQSVRQLIIARKDLGMSPVTSL